MNVTAALQRFFEGFGLPAYGRDDVPDGARLPYITYEAAVIPDGERVPLRAWVWYPGNARRELLDKCGQIADALREGGACLCDGDGAVYLMAARPFARECGEGKVRGMEVGVEGIG